MTAPVTRIDARFAALKQEGRAGLVCFVTAGDPNPETGFEILSGLANAGADIIELGMPFSDPMADGPAIQAASQRALKSGMTLKGTLDQVRRFREIDDATPMVLMGYFNPIYSYGVDAFLKDAKESGVDGLIVVDMPPEEEGELCLPAQAAGLNFIYLTAPTTNDARLPRVVEHASGFVYYVSITGITGTRSAKASDIEAAVKRIKGHTGLPVAVGFGINTPEQVAEVGKIAEAAVVGSALVKIIAAHVAEDGGVKPGCADAALAFVGELARGLKADRKEGAVS